MADAGQRDLGRAMAEASSTRSTVLGVAAIAALTLAAYAPAIRGGFVWDDDAYVTENRALRSLDGLRAIWLDVRATPQYYPLVHSTFWAEYHLWGRNPLGYHIVNVAMHAAGAVLLWLVLRRLSVPGAFFAAAIFAVHPVHVESVAWVTERKNVLSGVFYFASLLAYLRFARVDRPRFAGPREWRFYVAAVALFGCALLSKTVTCSLPAAILLILWWKRERLAWRDVVPLLPMFAIGAAMGLTTAWVERHHVGAEGADWSLSFVGRCLVAGRAAWFYAGKLIWPASLTFIYPRWQIDTGQWRLFAYPAGVLAVVGTLWVLRKRLGKGPLVAVLFFLGTLTPALGFIDVYPMRYSFVADHFQYLASIGLIVLFAAVLSRILTPRGSGRRRSAFALGAQASVLGLLAVLTWRQGHIYADARTLWTDTLEKNPSAWIAHNNLANLLFDRGQADLPVGHYAEALRLRPDYPEAQHNLGVALARSGKTDEAIEHYRQALRLAPDLAEAHHNLGIALARQGKVDEAAEQYAEALRLKPNYPQAHNNLANLLADWGKVDEAIDHYRRALQLEPDLAEANQNLGRLLVRQGRAREAIPFLVKALQINRDFPEAHYNLGRALADCGRTDEAVAQFTEALRLRPASPEAHNAFALALSRQGRTDQAILHYREALRLQPDWDVPANDLAWILATDTNSAVRNGAEAVRLAEQACRGTANKDPQLLDTLAAAYAEAGRFADAIRIAQQAVSLATEARNAALAAEITQRMKLYEAGRPWHGSP